MKLMNPNISFKNKNLGENLAIKSFHRFSRQPSGRRKRNGISTKAFSTVVSVDSLFSYFPLDKARIIVKELVRLITQSYFFFFLSSFPPLFPYFIAFCCCFFSLYLFVAQLQFLNEKNLQVRYKRTLPNWKVLRLYLVTPFNQFNWMLGEKF